MHYASVAPHMGAWIEITTGDAELVDTRSHPTWVRGLKLRSPVNCWIGNTSHPTWVRGLKCKPLRVYLVRWLVAPHMGAWIEIFYFTYSANIPASHPTWVRGLKFNLTVENMIWSKSHPTWVRGLKYSRIAIFNMCVRSHPTWVRGLKYFPRLFIKWIDCRTPHGCVD